MSSEQGESVLTLYGVIVEGCWIDIYNHYRVRVEELTQSMLFSVLTMSPHIPTMLCDELHIDYSHIVRFEMVPLPANKERL